MSQPSITCPKCGLTSYNPNDIEHGYCGFCHDWTRGFVPIVTSDDWEKKKRLKAKGK